MIELGKKTIISAGIGYQWPLSRISKFLEDSHINILYAYNSLNKTPFSYIANSKVIKFDLSNYKEVISENIFRIDYIFIESNSGIVAMDKWLSELGINIVYITNEDTFMFLKKQIDFTNQYSIYTKIGISDYNNPGNLENYIIVDHLLDIKYSLQDLITSLRRDKKIKDLGID